MVVLSLLLAPLVLSHQIELSPGHDQPDPGPRRHRDPRPVQATEVLLHPVRSRAAQRDLAVRLHPLPTHPARRQHGPTSRSSPGSTTTPATPCTSPPTPGSPHRSCSPPSGRPLTCTDTPRPRSPTTAWSTPPGSPAAAAAATASSRATPPRHRPEELPPNHPTTCGKVERFQQTLKKWLRAQPDPADHHRRPPDPPRRLRRRVQPPPPAPLPPAPSHPGDRLRARPKATPTADRSTDSHDRVRHDKINKAGNVTLRVAGRLRHIGIGRTYAGTHVLLLVQDLDVRVVDAATGELLRDLTIDPTPRLPTHRTTTGPDQKDSRTYESAGPAVADVLRHHTVGLTGFEPATP